MNNVFRILAILTLTVSFAACGGKKKPEPTPASPAGETAKPAEAKPAEEKPAEEKPTEEAKPAEEEPTEEAKPAEDKPTEAAGGAEKPAEDEPAEEAAQPEEGEPAEDEPAEAAAEEESKTVMAADIEYQPLDPAHPDGPQAAFVYGSPEAELSAIYMKFPAGFSPGVHSHTSSYHAFTLSGAVQHWLPGEENPAELPVGTYWYQKGGEDHGDKCIGPDHCVLFVIFEGKFDFHPAKKDAEAGKGEHMMTKWADAELKPMNPDVPAMRTALVYGDPKTGPVGMIGEMDGGYTNPVHKHSSDYFAVVLEGTGGHSHGEGADKAPAVGAGGYWFQKGDEFHQDACQSEENCKFFAFFPGALDFTPKDAPPAADKAADDAAPKKEEAPAEK